MARKCVERCIAYDDRRQCYYVTLDSGKDLDGIRQRRWVTCPNLAQARHILRSFEAKRSAERRVKPSKLTLGEWLDHWMEEVVVPNRAFTPVIMIGSNITSLFSKLKFLILSRRNRPAAFPI